MANGEEQDMTAMASNIDEAAATLSGSEYDQSAWSRSVTHIIAMADKQNVRTIGITATQTGAGVSMLSRAITESYLGFGKKTLLAHCSDTAHQKTKLERDENGEVLLPPTVSSTLNQPTVLCLPEIIDADMPRHKARNHLNELTAQFDVIVVDLPPVSMAPGRSTPEFMRFAPLCDLIFLICVTNMTPREELRDCLEQCIINDAKLGGIIMNDRQLIGSELIAS